jgi:hypothetical protein
MFTRNKEVLHSLFSYKDRFVFLGYKTLQCSYRKTNVIFGDSIQGKTKNKKTAIAVHNCARQNRWLSEWVLVKQRQCTGSHVSVDLRTK